MLKLKTLGIIIFFMASFILILEILFHISFFDKKDLIILMLSGIMLILIDDKGKSAQEIIEEVKI